MNLIQNARVVPIPYSTPGTLRVVGNLEDGTRIETSKIVSGPDDDNVITTRNGTYKLEMACKS